MYRYTYLKVAFLRELVPLDLVVRMTHSAESQRHPWGEGVVRRISWGDPLQVRMAPTQLPQGSEGA